jgi:hypothetical protein
VRWLQLFAVDDTGENASWICYLYTNNPYHYEVHELLPF